MNRFKYALATCGFLGAVPFAPGTFGTLGGVLIAWALAGTEQFRLWVLVAAAVVTALGIALGDWAERYADGKDPQFFVLDEVAGYLLTIWWFEGPSLLALFVAFCAFRFFDIQKPFPIRKVERVGGGAGIVLDDLVAGVYGLLVVMVPARLLIDAPWSAAS
ncbi:MAG: phosphatidylglycerophosphatase A [Planctomycetes bacterium]|nr:phosphatidylglycerophosphatase A [Planctomycetota bacterium]